MKFYQLFIKTNCVFCKKAIDLLDKREEQCLVTVLDRAPSEVVEGLKRDYNHSTVPIIIEHIKNHNGQSVTRKVGGFTELFAELNIQDADYIPLEEMNEEQKQKDAEYWNLARGED